VSAPWLAYPIGKGSGSVTAFADADGFIIISRQREYLEAGEVVEVQPLDSSIRPADLVVMGSQCVGLDYLLGLLQNQGWAVKFLAVGSTGGLEAIKRGECDIAGMHLFDSKTGEYNRPFLTPGLELIVGYLRRQGLVFRADDVRFARQEVTLAVANALQDPECMMVNRSRGSGTRVLIDRLLEGRRPPGYLVEARTHNAVAAAIAQGRADWGVAIAPAARAAGLAFSPIADEHYDFVMRSDKPERPAVTAFRQLLARGDVRDQLANLGLSIGTT
jgi:putative molybdopterin biosynthesis protein